MKLFRNNDVDVCSINRALIAYFTLQSQYFNTLMHNEGVKWDKLKINKCVIHLSVCVSLHITHTWCLKSYFVYTVITEDIDYAIRVCACNIGLLEKLLDPAGSGPAMTCFQSVGPSLDSFAGTSRISSLHFWALRCLTGGKYRSHGGRRT
jgi:hypothetical protein